MFHYVTDKRIINIINVKQDAYKLIVLLIIILFVLLIISVRIKISINSIAKATYPPLLYVKINIIACNINVNK